MWADPDSPPRRETTEPKCRNEPGALDLHSVPGTSLALCSAALLAYTFDSGEGAPRAVGVGASRSSMKRTLALAFVLLAIAIPSAAIAGTRSFWAGPTYDVATTGPFNFLLPGFDVANVDPNPAKGAVSYQ